jgi:hypothetical protein
MMFMMMIVHFLDGVLGSLFMYPLSIASMSYTQKILKKCLLNKTGCCSVLYMFFSCFLEIKWVCEGCCVQHLPWKVKL